jgi:hypothetical protein
MSSLYKGSLKYTLSNYDTFILAHIEILSARLLIILHMARYSQTFIFSLFSYLSKVNIYKYKTKLH